MESKELIESGNLELYVLGQLNLLEKEEVERYAALVPAIEEEIKKIQIIIQNLAFQGAINPRAGVKQKIASTLIFAEPEFKPNSYKEPVITKIQDYKEESVRKGPIISFSLYVTSLAASFALLIIGGISYFRLSEQLKDTQVKYLAAISVSKKYASTASFLKEENEKTRQSLADSNTVSLRLQGSKSYPQAQALVFWNKKQNQVKLIPNGLPENDNTHSYQLWALVKGKPVDEGTFDVRKDSTYLMDMHKIAEAGAFAITLEPKGGSTSPHLDQLVVIGTI